LFCWASFLCFGQAVPDSRQDAVSRDELRALREAFAAQQKQLDALKAELASLKAQQAVATAPESLPMGVQEEQLVQGAAKPAAGWEGGHFFVQARDGGFQLQPIGYLQLDHRAYAGGTPGTNTFVLRRARLGMQGRLTPNVQFRLEGDFTDRNGTLLREASLNLVASPYLQFRFGQFKEPFSQELVTRDSELYFVERSLAANILMGANAFTPGASVHGALIGSVLQYEVGAFNARGALGNADTSTPEAVFRLRASPWRNTSTTWLRGLVVGGAVTTGRAHNANSFAGSFPTQSFTFFAAEKVNGNVRRTNGELTWTWGPGALRAEYSQGWQERLGLGPANSDLPAVSAQAFYVMGSYLLTGEKQPESGQAAPLRPAFGQGGTGIGAWEIKFRYSGQHMKDGLLNTRADEFSTGFNWYLTTSVSYLFDINLERLRTPVASPTPLLPQDFITVLSRVQFRF
jgi:phosphate-selective porin